MTNERAKKWDVAHDDRVRRVIIALIGTPQSSGISHQIGLPPIGVTLPPELIDIQQFPM